MTVVDRGQLFKSSQRSNGGSKVSQTRPGPSPRDKRFSSFRWQGGNDLALHRTLQIQSGFFHANRAACVKAYLGVVRAVRQTEKPFLVFHFLDALQTWTETLLIPIRGQGKNPRFAVSTLSPCIGACTSALGLGSSQIIVSVGNSQNEKSNVRYSVCYQNRN